MSLNSQDITFENARIVQGHAVRRQPVTDDSGTPKKNADGSPQTKAYFALAVKKGAEQDWKQTPWGQRIQLN